MKYFAIILALLVVANAIDVQVTTRAYFTNLVGGANRVYCRPNSDLQYGGPTQLACDSNSVGLTVPPPTQGRWGYPATNLGRSGLGFTPIPTRIVALDTDFYLGSITHFNFPIYNASTGITLNVIMQVKDAAGSRDIGTYTYTFALLIDETPNYPPCPYPGTFNCSDKITFQNNLNLQSSFTLENNVSYTLRLQGFKESNSSSSSAVAAFISNEYGTSVAFLFARITAACPPVCVNGGSPILINNRDCRCICDPNSPCPSGQVSQADCSCRCPVRDCGAGTVDPNNGCNCSCPACPTPRVLDPTNCNCVCPNDICGSGTVLDQQNCPCQCPQTACPRANEVRNARCNCTCQLSCPVNYVEDPNPLVCGCICASTTCQPDYTKNPQTCVCECTKTCSHSQLDPNTCTCGPCEGNYTGTNGNCVCGLTSGSCQPGERFDAGTCKCVCDTLVCDQPLVIDETAACACRPCRAGECICGNHVVQDGEECDPIVATPCCVGCLNTTNSCDDLDKCTDGDACDGKGNCKGDYKCPPSTECATVTCDPNVGDCVTTPVADNTPCGAAPYDLCNRRCIAGVCQTAPTVCPADTNTTDCLAPVCNGTTGLCDNAPTTGTGCSDGNPCTINDVCTAGVCAGTPKVCPTPSNPCQRSECQFGDCVIINLSGLTCNADSDACTVGDLCVRGICTPGTVTLCETTEPCKISSCDKISGQCVLSTVPTENNVTCDDRNLCTRDDQCVEGVCQGIKDETLANTRLCGIVPPSPVTNPAIIVFSVAGAAALIGAIIGIAFLIRKIRNSQLMNPDSWNPDMFSSIGANPLYKGNKNVVDNALYADPK